MTAGGSVGEDTAITRAELIVARALQNPAGDDLIDVLGGTLATFYPKGREATAVVPPRDLERMVERLPVLLQHFKELAWRSDSITSGAKDLVATTSQVDVAFRIVVTDKSARPVLRERYGIDVARVLESSALPVVVPPGAGGAIHELSFGEACRQSGVEFRMLERAATTISFTRAGEDDTLTLAQLVDALQQPSDQGRVVAAFTALWRASEQFLIVVLFAAWEAGRIEVHPRHRPQFRMFCARALLAQNASESAYRQALALSRDQDAVAQLSRGEVARLRELTARAGVRSGRAAEVMEQFLELYVTDPSPEVFRMLLGVACVSDPSLARAMCHAALGGSVDLGPKDWIFVGELLRGFGHPEHGLSIAQGLLADEDPIDDAYVSLANVALDLGNDVMWRTALTRYFEGQDLAVRCEPGAPVRPFAFVDAGHPAVDDHPMITIVMTTFNAVDTLEMSVASVRAQTCRNWELIIVDDVSVDGTPAIISRLEAADPRITSIHNAVNVGTYVAKNAGIRVARGEFITFHDSDDWMHPLRLQRHLEAMEGGAACTTSRWLRMDAAGRCVVRRGGPFVHLNPASTFYRRAALDAVGFFDAVRTGADSELMARVRATVGVRSVVNMPDCLGLGLHHDASLTRSGAAAFDEHRFSPVRIAYWESWLRWHVIRIADAHSLFNPGTLGLPYAVPDGIRP